MQVTQDPSLVVPLFVIFATTGVGLILAWLMHTLHEYSEQWVPRHRRQLEATYASFRQFLMRVRVAATRSLVE